MKYLWIVPTVIIFTGAQAWAQTAHVQMNSVRDLDTNSTASVSTTSNVAAGSTVLGSIFWIPTTSNLTSVSVCGTNGTLPGSTVSQGTSISGRSYYRTNVSSGACTVTATFDAGVTDARLIVHEASGIDTTTPLDGNACNAQNNPGTGTDAVTSGNITSTTTGQYIFGATAIGASATITPGTGFTQGIDSTTRESEYIANRGSSGSIATTFTGANGQWVTCGMSFFSSVTSSIQSKGVLLGVF